jgi:hypothetical protein
METWMIVPIAGVPFLIASAFAWEGIWKRRSKGPPRRSETESDCAVTSVGRPSSAGAMPTSHTKRVGQTMQAQGRPVDNFNQQVADMSVDQPRFAENYREPRDAAMAIQRGAAQTEDLGGAGASYMTRFEELLETNSQLKSR